MENGKVPAPLKFKGFFTSEIDNLVGYQNAFAKIAANAQPSEETERKIRQIITSIVRMAYIGRQMHFQGIDEGDQEQRETYDGVVKGFEQLVENIDAKVILKAAAEDEKLPYFFALCLLVDMYLYRLPSYLPPEEDYNLNKQFSHVTLISEVFYHLLFIDQAAIAMTKYHPFENLGWMLRQPMAPALFPIRIGELQSVTIDEKTL